MEHPPQPQPRVLVVDDLPSARKVIVRHLHRLGYQEVAEAGNGEQALTEFQRAPFDLVISDWHMPGIDGLELFRRLHELSADKETAFLFVTSSNDRDEVLSALKAGVREYLCKPFTVENLEKKLVELLSKRL